jgi:hypothetical protein
MPHGGKRSGSGRKKTKLSVTGKKLKKVTAEEILSEIDEKKSWHELLTANEVVGIQVVDDKGKEVRRENVTVPNYKIRLEALKYVTDKRDGKAPQAVKLSSPEGEQLRVTVEHIGSPDQASA